MKIRDQIHEGEPSLSFEFSPPKDEAGEQRLFETIRALGRYRPTFVSMTCGAGGSTRRSTAELVDRIQREYGLCAMAHLTCTGVSASEIAQTASDLAARGVENVLALRGDPPKGENQFVAAKSGFAHAAELVAFLRQHFDFGIAAGCYPEKHAEAPSLDHDLLWLREKVDAGAEYLITQLFFEPSSYSEFVARARAFGIRVPILPGVLPATELSSLLRMSRKCGANVPRALVELLEPHAHDPAAMTRLGVELTRAHCQALLTAGAPGLHFYTRNRDADVAAVLDSLGFDGRLADSAPPVS